MVCTIGPATESVSAIKDLYDAGMSVARINLSHGDHEQYRRFIKNIRAASKNIAVMFDTKGPEIRTGMVKDGTVLKEGSIFHLTTNRILGDDHAVYVDYPGLLRDVKKGDHIMMDSGFLELRVIGKNKTDIICRVISGGPLGNQKGVNHPSCVSDIPGFTKQDRSDLELGVALGIDFVAASFVRYPEDVLKIKDFLKLHPHIKVFAKIETGLAVKNFDEILTVSDGIMVARGDLGVELPEEEVPLIQKDIIRKCNLAGKPVVTATQMLESMVSAPRPTRAEASDVANAILDGTDAVMLSEETAIGKYPAKAVEVMVNIAEKTEAVLKVHRRKCSTSTDDAIADAAADIVEETGIHKIIVSTCSGYSARLMSAYRPHADIIAVTPNEYVVRQMSLYWGVMPILINNSGVGSTRALIYHSVKTALDKGLLRRSDKVVVTAAHPFNVRGKTNLLELHTVGELIDRGPTA
ncbi:MAG: pyruvate kinase [Candidatus Woesearchaeota archaeon]